LSIYNKECGDVETIEMLDNEIISLKWRIKKGRLTWREMWRREEERKCGDGNGRNRLMKQSHRIDTSL